MKQKIISKTLAVAVIILFLGLSIQPSVAVQPETEIDIEPKDYLFLTIIDIANNPEVKELLENYDNDLFKIDIDRSVYRRLLLRNPRLMFNKLFTKPSMSIENLNNCYNRGIEITNIIGEDKVLEMIETVEVTDIEFFDELNNIIVKDDDISNRLAIIEEINKELNTDSLFEKHPIICYMIFLLFGYEVITGILLADILNLFEKLHIPIITPIMRIFLEPWILIKGSIMGIIFVLIFIFECMEWPLYI